MPNYKLLSNDVSDFCVNKVPVIETEKRVLTTSILKYHNE